MLGHIERNIMDLQRISDRFKHQVKTLDKGPDQENKHSLQATPKPAITEKEPNDSYKQGMEIPIGVVSGALSETDRQDFFRFELEAEST